MAVQYEGWSIVAQYRKCGKKGCKTCTEGPGHGPYYYGTKVIDGRRRSKYFGKTLPTDIDSQGNIQDSSVLQSKVHGLELENEQLRTRVQELEAQLSSYQSMSTDNDQSSSAVEGAAPMNEPLPVQFTSPVSTSENGELTRAQVEQIWNEESSLTETPKDILDQAHDSFINGLFKSTQDTHTRLNKKTGKRPYVCPFRSGGRGGHRTFGSAERLVRSAVLWLIENVSKQKQTKRDILDQAERKRQEHRKRYEQMSVNHLKALREKMSVSIESGSVVGWTMSLSELEQELKVIDELLREQKAF